MSALADETSQIGLRVANLDWRGISAQLEAGGVATTGPLLSAAECAALRSSYPRDEIFRSRVIMARHGFGKGEYKYFAYPLPDIVSTLRGALWPPLAHIANGWNGALGLEKRYPPDHQDYLAQCHEGGQLRPTPLMLKYGPGDYNCLHQDLYGEHVFPLQAVFLLSDPATDFEGGELVLTEQRPRMQSRVEVVKLQVGHAAIFAVHQRPVRGGKGIYRVNIRHGVSRVRSGERYTLGLIFHDAQ